MMPGSTTKVVAAGVFLSSLNAMNSKSTAHFSSRCTVMPGVRPIVTKSAAIAVLWRLPSVTSGSAKPR